jgi:hypothetical protein
MTRPSSVPRNHRDRKRIPEGGEEDWHAERVAPFIRFDRSPIVANRYGAAHGGPPSRRQIIGLDNRTVRTTAAASMCFLSSDLGSSGAARYHIVNGHLLVSFGVPLTPRRHTKWCGIQRQRMVMLSGAVALRDSTWRSSAWCSAQSRLANAPIFVLFYAAI